MINYSWEILEKSKPASVGDVFKILLRNRGVDASFLNCTLKDLECHLTMKGMDSGAALMARHLASGNKVVLIGDYDCDGVTSLAQLVHFLRDIGYDHYAAIVPQRVEGYGVPERAILQHRNARLFLAVDCGTHDIKSVSAARHLGADFIAIDHHEVSSNGMAPTNVLINPKQPSCPSVFKDFSASGLTLLFLSRLRKALGKKFPIPRLGGKYLALAAIGTIADVVPLVDANRILAQNGLGCMNAYSPIRKLAETAGLAGKVLTAGHVGYYLGPRINAAGRIGDASLALNLLTAELEEDVGPLLDTLNSLNTKRQHIEDRILGQIRNRYTETEAYARRRTLVMGDSQWPQGVVGIIASRIQRELHYGPTIIFSIDDVSGVAKGSARSIPGFDVYSALKSSNDLLLKWGGHKMAAGLTISLEDLDRFSERFEELACTYPPEVFIPRRKVDMELDLELVSPELFGSLKQLEPHGIGNPLPTFAARNVRIAVQRTFGKKRRHLQLLLDNRIDGIFWQGDQYMPGGWEDKGRMDVVFQLDWDSFRDRPVLSIKDVGKLNMIIQEPGVE